MELGERGKGFWTGVVVVLGLIALTPFVKWVQVNLFDLVGLFLAVTTVTGYFVFEGLRHSSEQVVLMREGEHISRSQVGEVARLDGTPGVSPSRTGITYGGLEINRLNTANRNLMDVPASAVERMDGDFLVYAPSVPLSAEQLFGLDSAMSDLAEESVTNAYRSGERSPSRARFSLFNSLTVDPTADQLRSLCDEILRSAKKVAEGKRRGAESEGWNVKRLRKLSETTRRPSFTERVWRLATGGPDRGQTADKPSGEEGE